MRPLNLGSEKPLETRHKALRNPSIRGVIVQRDGATEQRTDGQTLFQMCIVAPRKKYVSVYVKNSNFHASIDERTAPVVEANGDQEEK